MIRIRVYEGPYWGPLILVNYQIQLLSGALQAHSRRRYPAEWNGVMVQGLGFRVQGSRVSGSQRILVRDSRSTRKVTSCAGHVLPAVKLRAEPLLYGACGTGTRAHYCAWSERERAAFFVPLPPPPPPLPVVGMLPACVGESGRRMQDLL